MSVQVLPENAARAPAWRRPTRLSLLIFAAKAAGLRLRRAGRDLVAGSPRLERLRQAEAAAFAVSAGVSVTPLWSDPALTERALQQGKVENLRVAARALDGLALPAGAVFSFWRQVGPPLAARGFVRGRMLQQGCMISAVGGGLCQLSNALYEAALQAGCRIVERHAHSSIVPGSAAALGRDATVAWNYVDLRFAAERDLWLSVRLDRDDLTVRLTARTGETTTRSSPARPAPALPPNGVRDCGSCDETACVLHRPAGRDEPDGSAPRVFLVDEAWPEFQRYVHATRAESDRLGRPIEGARLGLARHAWRGEGFDRVVDAPAAALGRSLAFHLAGGHGPRRRRVELAAAGVLSARLGRLLTPDVTSVVVAQSYLPHLWRAGLLGGREVSVLMTRPPMGVIEARLDAAAARRPEAASLSDFRAPPALVQAEAEALAAAHRIVTPHAEIAALFGDRAVKLDWAADPSPPRQRSGPIRRIAFAGPTAARKGAFAVREAALALDLDVMPLGAELEGPDFWRGVRTTASGEFDVLVQPALAEEQPRRLLAALAVGVSVIASPACGLGPQPGLTLIAPDDAEALIAAIRALDESPP